MLPTMQKRTTMQGRLEEAVEGTDSDTSDSSSTSLEESSSDSRTRRVPELKEIYESCKLLL